MTGFIYDVLKDLDLASRDTSKLTLILPNKRAGLFLKRDWSSISKATGFLPDIISIEHFIEELSQLRLLSNTELIFEFYKVYLELTPLNERDSFDRFSKWAPTVIQDFNEIDRYLINQTQIFNYLSAIQEINSNHWSLEENKTTLIKNYLDFWYKLESIYLNFKENLLEKNIGYQGLIYREAYNNIESYIQANSNKRIVFLGFNALNSAEIGIIKELLHNGIASVYWDVDKTFIENSSHDAGVFMRQHKLWNYYNKHDFNWFGETYKTSKNISVIGVPKNVGQAKYIGELLIELKNKSLNNLNNTALILGNENLLFPMLTSIPEEIKSVNITMDLPLKTIPLSSLFDQLIVMHKDNKKQYYYKDIINIISCLFSKCYIFSFNRLSIKFFSNPLI